MIYGIIAIMIPFSGFTFNYTADAEPEGVVRDIAETSVLHDTLTTRIKIRTSSPFSNIMC